MLAMVGWNGYRVGEYIYLLTELCITFGKTDSAEKLIMQLKRNSSVGKKEIRELESQLQ